MDMLGKPFVVSSIGIGYGPFKDEAEAVRIADQMNARGLLFPQYEVAWIEDPSVLNKEGA